MVAEDYVSFEVAKLLKEKGFDVNCYTHYSSDGQNVYYNYRTPSDGINMPTLQMAMKWLREVHSIEVHISLSALNSDGSREYMFDVFFTNERYLEPSKTKAGFGCYEEAARAAIKYCLENLMQ